MDKNNKDHKSGSGKIIRILTKFKSFKNSNRYKKLIKNLVKFKIFKKSNFLSLAARLTNT